MVIGIAIGIAAYWLFNRTAMRLIRSKFGSDESSIRKALLDKMGYDALLSFQKAVEAEIARRRV